ncbi:hypothetical protein QIA37_00275 (plasmid) [Borrelia sp. CA_690]|nr:MULTISPECIES: hypothetical protein [Borrelia]WKC83967.1 hypothetical protein QIA37_00275 [Borrelia sp. CA_690]
MAIKTQEIQEQQLKKFAEDPQKNTANNKDQNLKEPKGDKIAN